MIRYIECRNQSDRTLLGVIFDATSIIWQVEYTGTGQFQITVPYTTERYAWLSVDNYITRPDRTELGFIEKKTVEFTATQGRTITVEGHFGCVLLARRLYYQLSANKAILKVINSNVLIEDACRSIVGNTLIASDTASRNVSWLSLGVRHGYDGYPRRQESTAENALDFVRLLLTDNASPLGHRVTFDKNTRTATYDVYTGQTRDLVFSQEYNNLLSFKYSHNAELVKTHYVIAGDGDGASRFFTERNQTYSNELRREFLYESGVAKTYNDANGNEHTYSDADYAIALRNDCYGVFNEHVSEITISGSVDLSLYNYGTDYNVGDVVTIRDDGSNIQTQARIWSVTEVQDENGYAVEANFEGENE